MDLCCSLLSVSSRNMHAHIGTRNRLEDILKRRNGMGEREQGKRKKENHSSVIDGLITFHGGSFFPHGRDHAREASLPTEAAREPMVSRSSTVVRGAATSLGAAEALGMTKMPRVPAGFHECVGDVRGGGLLTN
jgi:hypothetical protein